MKAGVLSSYAAQPVQDTGKIKLGMETVVRMQIIREQQVLPARSGLHDCGVNQFPDSVKKV